MSWTVAESPRCAGAKDRDIVETVIHPKPKDIGAFSVRRCLPSSEKRSIGPFVFFDEMGPATMPPGVGMDVRPHPHVNLATITFMFDGEIHHRDSLGTSAVIRPGAINLMVAGRGITHSERSPEAARPVEASLHGLQLWIALPETHEETEPAFHHYPAADLPVWEESGARIRLLVGDWGAHQSPVKTFSSTLYAAIDLAPNAEVTVADAPERGLYIVDGAISIAGERHEAGAMVVLRGGVAARIHADSAATVALIGGEPLGERFMYWNFVSSRRARIEQAKDDWAHERFAVVPGDEAERIPLPDA